MSERPFDQEDGGACDQFALGGASCVSSALVVVVAHNDLQFVLRTRKAAPEGAERASLQAVAEQMLAALNSVIDRNPVSFDMLDACLKQAACARAVLADDASRERSVVQVFAFHRMRRQLAAQLLQSGLPAIQRE